MNCQKHNQPFVLIKEVATFTDKKRKVIACEKCWANRRKPNFVALPDVDPKWRARYKECEARLVAKYGVGRAAE